jgi:ABC-type sugar transport system ATPase subunit
MSEHNQSAGTRPVLLTAENITKRFGAVVALDSVRVEIRAGEILALAGENGSGKSTLAKIMAGVLQADAGHLRLGAELHDFPRPRDALDAGVALVTQELTAVPAMSVAENVLLTRLHRYLARVDRRHLEQEARPYLEQVGLRVDGRMPFAALGPGQRELVEVAKALAAHPKVLILDEATTRLPDSERLFALMESLATGGLAIVFITQRLREIERVAHRAVVLRDGCLAGALARDELSEDRLARLMVGRQLNPYRKSEHVPGEERLRLDGLITDRSPAAVTLSVHAGEVVGLAGLVGAGRSELLETIAGARRVRGGRILLDGRPLGHVSPRGARRAGIALLPEDRRGQGLVMGASVITNFAIGSWKAFAPTRRGAEERAARRIATRLRISTPSLFAPVATLSGGNQQKVVIGRCIQGSPGVLLLDEPTRGVDVGVREEIYAIIDELTRDGAAVLVASSDLPEVLALSDRVVVLNEGRLAGVLDRSQASEEAILRLAAGRMEAAA